MAAADSSSLVGAEVKLSKKGDDQALVFFSCEPAVVMAADMATARRTRQKVKVLRNSR